PRPRNTTPETTATRTTSRQSRTYARAAALVHTLGRCRWLERSNLTVACAVAVMYLEASNIAVSPTREQLTALAHELNNPRCTADRIASFLRTWKP
ncbi:hypothetical protein ACWC4A_52860, partial [Streptomyces mirabilis]